MPQLGSDSGAPLMHNPTSPGTQGGRPGSRPPCSAPALPLGKKIFPHLQAEHSLFHATPLVFHPSHVLQPSFPFLKKMKSPFLNFSFAKWPCCHLLAVTSWSLSEPALSLHGRSSAAGSGRAEPEGKEMHRNSSCEGPREVPKPGQSPVSGEGTQGWAVCVLCHGRGRGRAADTQRMWIPAGADPSQASDAHWLFGFDVPCWLHPAPHTPALCTHTGLTSAWAPKEHKT